MATTSSRIWHLTALSISCTLAVFITCTKISREEVGSVGYFCLIERTRTDFFSLSMYAQQFVPLQPGGWGRLEMLDW